LERLNDGEDINRAWKNIKENNKTSAKESLGLCELKKQEPWLYEESLRFLFKESRLKCIGYRIQSKVI